MKLKKKKIIAINSSITLLVLFLKFLTHFTIANTSGTYRFISFLRHVIYTHFHLSALHFSSPLVIPFACIDAHLNLAHNEEFSYKCAKKQINFLMKMLFKKPIYKPIIVKHHHHQDTHTHTYTLVHHPLCPSLLTIVIPWTPDSSGFFYFW